MSVCVPSMLETRSAAQTLEAHNPDVFCVGLKCRLLSAYSNEHVGLCCKGLKAIMPMPITEAITSVPMTEASHHFSAHSLGS